MTTTATWKTTNGRGGVNPTSNLSRHACGLPGTPTYLYFALALAGLLLLPDVQSLKVGGVEVRRLSAKVAEQKEDIGKLQAQVNQVKNVLRNDQVFSQILNMPPASAPNADSSRSDERIAGLQNDQPRRQGVISQEQPKTLTARANLAQRIGEVGDAVKARALYAALLPAMKRVLGPDDPETWAARAELAHWTGEAGEPDEASNQYAELVEDMKQVNSRDPGIPALRANRAWYTGLAGHPAEARDQYAELVEDMKQVNSRDPDIPALLANRDYWNDKANQSPDSDSTGN